MACDLGDLPRRQIAVDILGQLLALLAELIDLLGDVDRRFGLHVSEFFDLGFEFRDRVFEIQESLLGQGPLLLLSIPWGRGCRDGLDPLSPEGLNTPPAPDPANAKYTKSPRCNTGSRQRPLRARRCG